MCVVQQRLEGLTAFHASETAFRTTCVRGMNAVLTPPGEAFRHVYQALGNRKGLRDGDFVRYLQVEDGRGCWKRCAWYSGA